MHTSILVGLCNELSQRNQSFQGAMNTNRQLSLVSNKRQDTQAIRYRLIGLCFIGDVHLVILIIYPSFLARCQRANTKASFVGEPRVTFSQTRNAFRLGSLRSACIEKVCDGELSGRAKRSVRKEDPSKWEAQTFTWKRFWATPSYLEHLVCKEIDSKWPIPSSTPQ